MPQPVELFGMRATKNVVFSTCLFSGHKHYNVTLTLKCKQYNVGEFESLSPFSIDSYFYDCRNDVARKGNTDRQLSFP